MLMWSRRILPLVVVALCAVTAVALASTTRTAAARGGPLTGTWKGYISGSGVRGQLILITVNAKETGGSWKLGAKCYGPLTLDSISNGYHHYLRRRGRGVTCPVGDIDCLKRVGAKVQDLVTSHRGGEYNVSGTLRRVRHA